MEGGRLHFVLVPFLGAGHIIPMVDIAHLLADRGVFVSFITTPLNAARIRSVIDRAEASGLPIRFAELPFPCTEAGLPDGCENTDLVSSVEMAVRLFQGVSLLREPLVAYLRERQPPPSCIISDVLNRWSLSVAHEFGIPWLMFDGTCCFYRLCLHNISSHNLYESFADGWEPFLVPGLSSPVEITRAEAPEAFVNPTHEKTYVLEDEEASDGVVFNSCEELEHPFIDAYRKATGKKIWAIGPVSLHNEKARNRAVRGREASVDSDWCLRWLDSMKPRSVVYVNFGSLSYRSPPQLVEIGMGLEVSDQPFIWVINANQQSPEFEEWLSSGGFEERTKGRSLIIRGWVPQVAILSHTAVGGFVTHCGWNSSLEAISAGVPMITWPSFTDQFLNQKLIVEVLRIGVTMGVKPGQKLGIGELVKREVIVEAVKKLMDGGPEGEERRKRARELGEKAREAMEVGGSSYKNMTLLIGDISSRLPQ